MARDPQEQVRIGIKYGEQIGAGYDGVGGIWHVDKLNRYVRSDDHELVLSLTQIQFMHQPGQLIAVKTSLPMKIKILVRHGIVEHDDLERQIHLRFEAVTGKVVGDVGLAETVTDRL